MAIPNQVHAGLLRSPPIDLDHAIVALGHRLRLVQGQRCKLLPVSVGIPLASLEPGACASTSLLLGLLSAPTPAGRVDFSLFVFFSRLAFSKLSCTTCLRFA